jgi:pyruvate dehydrogenase E2 component (dihydrolipoamide acetyltransferase)
MVTHVKMPKLDLTMKKGSVAKWLKKEGERLEKGEALLEIETQKVACEVEAPASGILRRIVAQVGSDVPVGGLLAIITEPGEELPLEEMKRLTVPATEETAAAPVPAASSRPRATRTIPFVGMRRSIAERLSESHRTTLSTVLMTSVDMTETMRLRKELLGEIEKAHGAPLTYSSILVKTTAAALKDNAIVNSALEDDEIRIFEDINVGVAVSVEEGLIVPVVHKADKKSLSEIALRLKELTEKAKRQVISLSEVTGGTFTITNLGMHGVDVFVPIINPPQSAILGVGEILEKALVIGGQIMVRPVMSLTLVFDHRVFDGVQGARFLQTLKRILEDRHLLLDSIG